MKKYILISIILILSKILFSQDIAEARIDYITVNHTNKKVEIKWSVYSIENIDGYIIKRKIWNGDGVVDETFNNIEIINDNSQTFYTDNSNEYNTETKPYTRSEEYIVAAFKNENNTIVYSNMSDFHKTVFVEIKFDECKKQNIISWNNYKGWDIKKYEIFIKNNQSNNYQLLETTTDSTFIHQNILPNQSYTYYIKAISFTENIFSNSNEAEIFTKSAVAPKLLYADYATVNEQNKIELKFSTENDNDMKKYKLLKSNSPTNNFDTLYVFENNSNEFSYEDSVDIHTNYTYKLVAFDFCENKISESNLAQNIVLNANLSNENNLIKNELNWNLYNFWQNGTEQYNIYRSSDNSDFELIKTFTKETSFADELSDFIYSQNTTYESKGQFCYYIEAVENNFNDKKNTSKSNIECIIQEPIIFIPNAFNPKSSISENRIFKPKISFLDNYLLIIYNRWGAKIYQTNSIHEGWDGTINGGKLAQKGTYTYYIKYTNEGSQKVEKTGFVNLIY